MMYYILLYYFIMLTFVGFYFSIFPEILVDCFYDRVPNGSQLEFTFFAIFIIATAPFSPLPFEILAGTYHDYKIH